MGGAASFLNSYLREVGMGGPPADAAQQLQLTLLRQWTDHLEHALREEGVDGATAMRVIRSMIYGAVPMRADAEMRVWLMDEQRRHLETCAPPRGAWQPS